MKEEKDIAKKGDWVRIYNIILESEQRSDNLPEDTKKVPLEMWDKGFLVNEEAKIGDIVTVRTIIDREIQGTLVTIHPFHQVNYGDGVVETLYIGKQLREMLGDADE